MLGGDTCNGREKIKQEGSLGCFVEMGRLRYIEMERLCYIE